MLNAHVHFFFLRLEKRFLRKLVQKIETAFLKIDGDIKIFLYYTGNAFLRNLEQNFKIVCLRSMLILQYLEYKKFDANVHFFFVLDRE